MKPLAEQTHYEVLEVEPEAAPEAIRTAYERLRRLLGPGSLAVYSLVDPAEHQAHLLRLDEAWAVLSNETKRRAYDASIGLAPPPAATQRNSFAEAVAAISRSTAGHRQEEGAGAAEPDPASLEEPEPVELSLDDADVLEVLEIGAPGATGIRVARVAEVEAPPLQGLEEASELAAEQEPEAELEPEILEAHELRSAADRAPALELPAAASASPAAPAAVPSSPATPAAASASPAAPAAAASGTPEPASAGTAAQPAATPEVGPDTRFTGALLRQLREARGLSLQEIARRTRIHTTHLENIEAERWADLPPRVFLRGYLGAYARELRLDPTQVCDTYLAAGRGGQSR